MTSLRVVRSVHNEEWYKCRKCHSEMEIESHEWSYGDDNENFYRYIDCPICRNIVMEKRDLILGEDND